MNDRDFEAEELAQIYVGRGVESALARQVAQQLMAKDALGSHARDELGISEISAARPVQAVSGPSWNENMKCFLDLAINSENIDRPCSHY